MHLQEIPVRNIVWSSVEILNELGKEFLLTMVDADCF
jgi:hypothetical protein